MELHVVMINPNDPVLCPCVSVLAPEMTSSLPIPPKAVDRRIGGGLRKDWTKVTNGQGRTESTEEEKEEEKKQTRKCETFSYRPTHSQSCAYRQCQLLCAPFTWSFK